MAARSFRWICALLVIGLTLPGCASTGCGWWGRNSDCSSSVGNKSINPTQSGPLASTYTRPGNGMTTSPQQSSSIQGSSQNTPIVTSTPAQSMPGTNSPQSYNANSPASSSPLMNSNPMPGSYQTQNNPGAMSLTGLSRPELKSPPDVNVPTPTIPAPYVQPPPANFNMPATAVSGSGQVAPAGAASQPTPMMFTPPAAPSPVKPPSISAQPVTMPTVAPLPIDLDISSAKPASLPPPVAPPPTPPPLDGK
jgi:hypothetical protein